MIKNLIIIDRRNTISNYSLNYFFFNVKKFQLIKKYYLKFINIKYWNNFKKKYNGLLKKGNSKILYNDKLQLYKNYIPLKEFKVRYTEFLKKGRRLLDFLENRTDNYSKSYRNLDMHMVYENNILILALWNILDLNISIQILLENNKFENIYVHKDNELVYQIFKLYRTENKFNLYQIKRSSFDFDFLINKQNSVSRAISPIFHLIYRLLLKSHNKPIFESEKYSAKHVSNINWPNIGFLYFSDTHKRVGNDFFNYLKIKPFNIFEINPIPTIGFKRFSTPKNYRHILYQLKELYFSYIKTHKNPLFILYLKDVYNIILRRIKQDLSNIDYIYNKILSNKIDLLLIFNDNSLHGKISALICKQLKIPTIFIPHGAISETYIFTHPKWCDLMILNSEIEKEFLLNGKLNPDLYKERLIPLGNFFLKPKKFEKVTFIEDNYNSDYNRNLTSYKYKILIGLGIESNNIESLPYTNYKIINDIIAVLSQQESIKNYVLIIKLHPTDDKNKYTNFFKSKRKIPLVITHKTDIGPLIASADLFFTTPSTTILEAILQKIPTIILDYYYFVGYVLYCDDKVITTVKDLKDIKANLNKFLLDQNFREAYIKNTYAYGLKFCKGFEEENYSNKINNELENILSNSINKSPNNSNLLRTNKTFFE